MKEVTIVGAGLSGMVCGIILSRKGRRVIMYDAQKGIGGSPSLHPSVHTTPAQIPALWDYVGLNLEKDFARCDPYPTFYYGKNVLKFPAYVDHNTAYCIERGPRPTSIDNHVFEIATDSGVQFEFGKRVDFTKLKPNTVIATGLDPRGYERLGIDHRKIYGRWSYREIEDKSATGAIYMGSYTPDYAYTAQVNGLDYCLLFSHYPIRDKEVEKYRGVLRAVGMGDYPEPWRDVAMAVPAEARLFAGDHILAGTLSGMIEPFWGYGIVGAIISGMIAAKAVEDRDEAEKEHARFTRGFGKKFTRRDRFRTFSAPKRAFLTRAGLLYARLQCLFDSELASKPREPLRWFRE
jgi:flavin-dependent dehydrogenase